MYSDHTFKLEALQRPIVSPRLAEDLAAQLYGIEVRHCKELGSYEDRNYYLYGEGPSGAQEHVLKITNHHHSKVPGLLEAQNGVCLHLGFKGLRAPVPEPALDSRLITQVLLPDPAAAAIAAATASHPSATATAAAAAAASASAAPAVSSATPGQLLDAAEQLAGEMLAGEGANRGGRAPTGAHAGRPSQAGAAAASSTGVAAAEAAGEAAAPTPSPPPAAAAASHGPAANVLPAHTTSSGPQLNHVHSNSCQPSQVPSAPTTTTTTTTTTTSSSSSSRERTGSVVANVPTSTRQPAPSWSGSGDVRADGGGGYGTGMVSCKVRLLRFIPGTTLAAAHKTPELLRRYGHYLATVDMALADFQHQGVRPTHDWALHHVSAAVQQYSHLVGDPHRRALAERVGTLFTHSFLPVAPQLRQQMIHGDPNENNTIVDEPSQQVVAFIDWSDIVHCWLVAEVGMAVAYTLLMYADDDQEPLTAAGHVLAGYTAGLPLTDAEWSVLPVLVAGRLVQSTLLGLDTISREPANAAYVMPDEDKRWRCIELLLSQPLEQMSKALREAASSSSSRTDSDRSSSDSSSIPTSIQPLPPAVSPARICTATGGGSSSGEGTEALVTKGSMSSRFPPFKLELYLARYEAFPLQLSRSSCQPVPLSHLLSLADQQLQQQWEGLELGYPPNIGGLQLRQEVSLHYPGTSADDVLVCVPNEGIYVTMSALVSPGDTVVVMYPVYQTLVEVVRSLGATVKLWNMELVEDEEQPGQPVKPGFRLDALAGLMTPDVKLLVVNFPHNPSGWMPSQQQWGDIVDLTRQVGAWLFSDEIYRLLEVASPAPLPPAVSAFPERGISLGGLSKAHGLQGLRCGWLVCKDHQLLEQAERVKSYITTTGSIMSEALAVVALRRQQQLVGACKEIITDNIRHAASFFARWAHWFEWSPPMAGTLCLPRLLTDEPIESFCESCAEECGVIILPATVYDHEAASRGKHFRLGLGRTNFKEALEALEGWLERREVERRLR